MSFVLEKVIWEACVLLVLSINFVGFCIVSAVATYLYIQYSDLVLKPCYRIAQNFEGGKLW